MAVIYELRGRMAAYSELGINLFAGCAVGCRNCPDFWLQGITWERWISGARPRKNILFSLDAKRKKWRAIPAKSVFAPGPTPINPTTRPG